MTTKTTDLLTQSDGVDRYGFASALNANQLHHVERIEGGPWEISLVDVTDALSLADALTLKAELEALCEFAAARTPGELHRRTEPGTPTDEEGSWALTTSTDHIGTAL